MQALHCYPPMNIVFTSNNVLTSRRDTVGGRTEFFSQDFHLLSSNCGTMIVSNSL